MDREQLALNLFDIGAVKFGTFTLKSGIESPIYFDLRVIISFPKVLRAVAESVWEIAKDLDFDLLCGVPYTALPIATYLSIEHDVPMVMRRKEIKTYGTKRMIEGVFDKGSRCLIIEDLVTSGASIFETIEPLENEGLEIVDIIAFLNREQGGEQKIISRGYSPYFVFSVTELLELFVIHRRITEKQRADTLEFLKGAAV